MKPKITVYPDYMSTGLWDDEDCSLESENFERVLGNPNLLALKYWHVAWEFLADGENMSKEYWQRWNEDGQKLVDEFNKCQDEYEFIYKRIEL